MKENVNWEKKIEECEIALEKKTSDLDLAVERKNQIEDSLKEFDSQHEGLREERQRILALGENPEKINQKLRELRERHEIEEDELVGLTKRIEVLKKERQELINQRRELKRDYLAFQTIPLVAEFNQHGEKMGLIVSRLWDLLDQMGEPHKDNRAFKASTWEALKVVPRLYSYSEWMSVSDLKDWFKRD